MTPEDAILTRVRAVYRQLRHRTDPQGHGPLAAMERETLEATIELHRHLETLERVASFTPRVAPQGWDVYGDPDWTGDESDKRYLRSVAGESDA